ncbi:MerR family transcriptional regulator [Isoptericola halotolerans]|uniref:DNA-binding transcriptional MerR regulator n=1 Tax=Isoptericola halotolerans TaxID=300560 RepID=A0ABX2A894_9MICO|nr:MerR family transcriptional regulator [Isoptericola halotolerans]NOV98910.1 DNA-binding transcriptional MerR regulator [Isoptericola halotolerans]
MSFDGMTVGTVADLVRVSVRTLHHWDEIGLAVPSGRTSAGYRSYSPDDLGRVHRVLVYRELGLSLASIAEILDGSDTDGVEQLRDQQRMLGERIAQMQQMASAVDALLARKESGESLTAQEQTEIFGRTWRQEWSVEAHERWGGTEQWRQFEENVAALSPEERTVLHESGAALFAEMADARRAGVEPSGAAGIAFAERHRALMGSMWECSPSMHVLLGRMFVEDPRFRANLDETEPALSEWLRDAIFAAARSHGVDPVTARWE